MEKKFLRIDLCVKIILGKFGSLETNAVESPFSDVKSEDLVNIKVYKKGLGNIEDHIMEEEMMAVHALDDHLQPNSQSSVVVETVLQLRLLFLALLFDACPILSGDHVSWELLMQLLLHAEQEPFRISNEM